MAHKRKPPPPDPPELIAVRERMKPIDGTLVIRTPEFDKLWHLRWVNKHDNWFWRECARYGYEKVKPGEVQTPGARGDKTAGEITHGDLMLCKCPLVDWQRRQDDKELFMMAQLEGRMLGIKEAAASGQHAISVEQTLTIGEGTREKVIKV